MKITHLLLTLFIAQSSMAEDLLNPFQSISKSSFISPNPDLVVHETESHSILKSPLTNFDSYDYYYVQIPNNRTLIAWLADKANVVLHEPGEFAVLEIRNELELKEVSEKMHKEGGFCGMIQKLSALPVSPRASSPDPLFEEKRDEVTEAIKEVNEELILENISLMQSWETRHHSHENGVMTGQKLQEIYAALIPEDRNDVELELVDHEGSPQKSLIVRIKGQLYPEEIVILGSHLDSLSRDKANAPGADDNASGTSTNIEVFRVLMGQNIKPRRTIEIQAYAAEEIGLIGSGEIASAYKNQKKNVIAMVQFDMNGYASQEPKIHFISNGTDSGLTRTLQNLVELYLEVESTTKHMWFGSSDHASFTKRGFAAAFPTENPSAYNRKIHTDQDTLEHINSPKQIREFGKLGVAYMMHFAGF